MLTRYILLWLPMILIALVNATFRELVLVEYYEAQLANQLSTISLIILCFVYIWFIFPFLRIDNSLQTWWVGILWVLLTIVFEFSIGFFTSRTWESMLRDYDLLSGNIWTVFLIALLLAPYVFYTIKFSSRKSKERFI